MVTDRCPDCGAELRIRSRRDGTGQFVGCSTYPRCRFAADAGDQDLREEVHELRARLYNRPPTVSGSVAHVDRALRDVIAWAHPDRHPGGTLDATEATARLNALRQEVRA